MHCRFCKNELSDVLIDLGNSPASNSFLIREELNEPEVYFPLKVYVCSKCYLAQIAEYKKSNAIFNDKYVYFSSYSKSWLKHSKEYVELMMDRFGYDSSSLIVEVASNDGYLLQYFQENKVPVLGIEPTANTAQIAKDKGIETVVDFFGVRLANELVAKGIKANLILGNNVFAHVPDVLDFIGGMKILLKDTGVITMEFPHLMQLIDHNQFDTIYHEHFSYLSFRTTQEIFASQGLELFDVEELPTHGGSIRIYAKHTEDKSRPISENVGSLLEKEYEKGMYSLPYYENFQKRALKAKLDLIDFLVQQKRAGKSVAGYGAAAKGNTLLNFCGIKSDLIDFVADANPHKQNKFLPASHIPVVNEEYLKAHQPDYVIIFPWNLKDEITQQLSYIKDWGGKFVIPIPSLEIIT